MRWAAAVVFVALTLATARADVKSGPDVGSKPAGFKVHAATGAREGKEVDFPAERKDLPTVYYFVPESHFDRPMARFFKTVDEEIGKGKDKAEAVVVWMTENADAAKDRLPKVQQSLQLQATAFGIVAPDKVPKAWKINDEAHVTAVVVHKGAVKATAAHKSVNETDAKKFLTAYKKAVEGK